MWQILKILWALPLTVFGIVPALLVWLLRGRAQCTDGVLEFYGPFANRVLRLPYINFSAVTIGHIVIARDDHCCSSARTHEHTHVRQGEIWGVFFPFAYIGAGLYQWSRGRSFYWDNPFEVAARASANQQLFEVWQQANAQPEQTLARPVAKDITPV